MAGIFKNIYTYFIPTFIKNEFLWQSIVQMRLEENEIQKAIPSFELDERHLANLRILPDRLALLNRMPKNAIVAEIGVDEGEFSKQILSSCNPKKLHLIDYWDDEKYPLSKMNNTIKKMENQIQLKQVLFHRGLSVLELEKFQDNYFDWVYIDTDHSYLNTKQELGICSKKVKSNGIISGHDYLTRDYMNNTRYGVVEAVNEFCFNNDWEFIYLTHETNRHLSFAIRKRLEN